MWKYICFHFIRVQSSVSLLSPYDKKGMAIKKMQNFTAWTHVFPPVAIGGGYVAKSYLQVGHF